MQQLQSLVADDMTRVNTVILDSVNQNVPLISTITNHIVQSGGKRLRPSLTLACMRLLDAQETRHIPLAAAVELIHTATLLHDDVVDESTMRRGLETANSIWSNQASVLVGDFLFSRAFQLMVSDGSLEVLGLLSNASAIIAQGEVKQLMVTGNLNTTQDTYLDVIQSKTAALFSAACEIAPVITEDTERRVAFASFGRNLGIAFQLVDDALDYSAKQATLGKTIGDDLREGKITLPVIEAYQHGTSQQRQFWERVMGEQDDQAQDLDTAIGYITEHRAIETTMTLAKDYAAHAEQALYDINGNATAMRALKECIAFCVNRDV